MFKPLDLITFKIEPQDKSYINNLTLLFMLFTLLLYFGDYNVLLINAFSV